MLRVLSSFVSNRYAKTYWLVFVVSLSILTLSFNAFLSNNKAGFEEEMQLYKEDKDYKKKREAYNSTIRAYRDMQKKADEAGFLSLEKEIVKYESLLIENKKDIEFIELKTKQFNELIPKWRNRYLTFLLISIFASAITGVSLLHALYYQIENSRVHDECQSCGRSLNSVLMNYGTESDQSQSRSFCNKCYGNGKFLNPEMTPDEMRIQIHKELEGRNFSESSITHNIARVGKLKRWKYYKQY